ncbi:MAG: ABC transporter permease [Elusimicrobia bacterium]|nr:ABC transporter permease [Candidatus Liberimonas magnetica]
MNNSIRIIIGFVKKEFSQALRDPVMRVFIFVAPVLQLTIFGFAINNEFKNLKLAIFSDPTDVVARQLSDTMYSGGWFLPARPKGDAFQTLQSGRADAVLVMPRQGLTKTYAKNETVIQLLIDAKNATKARAIDTYVRSIVQKFVLDNLSGEKPSVPVVFDIRVLYNPTMETSIFMVPGIMTLIMSLITIIMVSMSLAREKELGTFETIIAAPIAKWQIIAGKAVPYMLIGLLDALIVLSAGVILFNVPIRGSLLFLITATMVFVTTTVSIGLLVSSIAQNQQQAMMGTFMFLFPAMLLSGVMFPIENMPAVIQFVAYFNPLMYYVKVIRNVMLKGANPEVVISCIAMLFAIGSIVVVATILRFRQKLN